MEDVGNGGPKKIEIARAGMSLKEIHDKAAQTPTTQKHESVGSLYKTAVYDKDGVERERAKRTLGERVDAISQDPEIDMSKLQIYTDVQKILNECNWDNYYNKLIERGIVLDRDLMLSPNYRAAGGEMLMSTLYRMIADATLVQGIRKGAVEKKLGDRFDIEDPVQRAWVGTKVPDDPLDEFKKREAILKSEVITVAGFSKDFNFAELVDKKPPLSEGEADYYSVKYPDLFRKMIEDNRAALKSLTDEMVAELGEANMRHIKDQAKLMEQFLNLMEGSTSMQPEIKGVENLSDKEKTLSYVRGKLDRIETKRVDWQGNQQLAAEVLQLEALASLQDLDPAIKKEIRVRLAIWDSSLLMRRAGGWIDQNPTGDINISAAVVTANLRGHAIEGEEMEWALLAGVERRIVTNPDGTQKEVWVDTLKDKVVTKREDKTGVEYPELKEGEKLTLSESTRLAWDLLETINSNRYRAILLEIGAVAPDELWDTEKNKLKVSTFFQDSDKDHPQKAIDRRNKVKSWVLQRMGYVDVDKAKKSGKYSEAEIQEFKDRNYVIQKSIQLAENLAIATTQTSRWGSELHGGRLFTGDENYGANDQLAECIYLKTWREGRAAAGRDRGPDITIPYVPGFGDSWVSVGKNTTRVVECIPKDMRNNDVVGCNPLLSKYINPESTFVGGDGIVAYATTALTRYVALKKELMTASYKPGEVNADYLKKINVYFKTAEDTFSKEKAADPKTDLRMWWVVHTLANSYGLESQWTSDTYNQFKTDVIRELIPGGVDTGFITKKQWDEITGWLKSNKIRFWEEFIRQNRAMPNAFERVTGAKPPRRK